MQTCPGILRITSRLSNSYPDYALLQYLTASASLFRFEHELFWNRHFTANKRVIIATIFPDILLTGHHWYGDVLPEKGQDDVIAAVGVVSKNLDQQGVSPEEVQYQPKTLFFVSLMLSMSLSILVVIVRIRGGSRLVFWSLGNPWKKKMFRLLKMLLNQIFYICQ